MLNLSFGRRLTAVYLSITLLCVSSTVTLAVPGSKDARLLLGELSSSGAASINGARATSGQTVFPDSLISTAEKDKATISLGELGRVELSPNSSIKLGFNDSANSVALDAGQVRVSAATGYSTTVTTKDGLAVADKSQASMFTVNVTNGQTFISTQQGKVEFHTGNEIKSIAAGEELLAGAAATPAAATAASARRKTLWILFGISVAVLVTALIVNANDDDEPVVSPTK